ncbi:hypothetical protein GMDG_02029 [Pseudogymnoascus destructans 20631-21]|uniref:Uncharacterized protein n=1 Tax=Pseudogymnoascus destructans (strain ATCC MYA-4855 / 20631-21) TaxID=658429 RepID=L8G0D5_PSED2|nr:hypothetical protein GMDG_02029 [Pseudogymnoascus destructans 20631-21]
MEKSAILGAKDYRIPMGLPDRGPVWKCSEPTVPNRRSPVAHTSHQSFRRSKLCFELRLSSPFHSRPLGGSQRIYKKNPEARLEAERAIKVFYDENKDNLERHGVTDALVKAAKHNDPRNPDPKGDHWTVELSKETGEFVTKRHVYPVK